MTPQEFKEIRLALGLSQQQLASKISILRGQISKIERGVAGITEQKEEAMKMLLLEHRLKIKKANSYTRPKREKICFAYPWYTYQKKIKKAKTLSALDVVNNSHTL